MKCSIFYTLPIALALSIPQLVFATPLQTACNNYSGGVYKTNVRVTSLSLSSLPSMHNNLAIVLSDSTQPYLMAPNATSNFKIIIQMINYAILLQDKVNVCVSDSDYFLGIEYVD